MAQTERAPDFRLKGSEPRRPTVVKRFRDSHHMIARMFAMGLRPGQVAIETGYCASRISVLQSDPAFRDLIATYREDVHGAWREEAHNYFSTVNRGRSLALTMMVDQLDDAAESGETIPLRTLKEVHADLADRSGYPKRTEVFTKDMDFAAMMDRRIEKTQKILELRAEPARLVDQRSTSEIDSSEIDPGLGPQPGEIAMVTTPPSVADPVEAETGSPLSQPRLLPIVRRRI